MINKQGKKKVGGRDDFHTQKKYARKNERERWSFPVMKGQYRIPPLVSAGISCIGFVKGRNRISPVVSAGISRIFLFDPIYLDFPYGV